MKPRIFFLSFMLFLSACLPLPVETVVAEPVISDHVDEPILQEIPLEIGYGVDGGWFELYFTDPTNPDAKYYRGGPDVRRPEHARPARAGPRGRGQVHRHVRHLAAEEPQDQPVHVAPVDV